jgi:hypothetical protein
VRRTTGGPSGSNGVVRCDTKVWEEQSTTNTAAPSTSNDDRESEFEVGAEGREGRSAGLGASSTQPQEAPLADSTAEQAGVEASTGSACGGSFDSRQQHAPSLPEPQQEPTEDAPEQARASFAVQGAAATAVTAVSKSQEWSRPAGMKSPRIESFDLLFLSYGNLMVGQANCAAVVGSMKTIVEFGIRRHVLKLHFGKAHGGLNSRRSTGIE